MTKELIVALLSMIESRHDIPQGLLVAMCEQESSLNPKAFVARDGRGGRSSKGLCQLQKRTWDEVCPEYNWDKQGFDPQVNAECGARYLGLQYSRYGAWDKALTAYNQGRYRGVVSKYAHKVRNRAEISDSEGVRTWAKGATYHYCVTQPDLPKPLIQVN